MRQVTEDLARWLGAQLDTDERIARAAADDGAPEWCEDVLLYGIRDSVRGLVARARDDRVASLSHIVEHDPARVLREIDAKRQLLARYAQAMENRRAHPDDLASAGALLALHGAVKVLALPYSDRPGYAEALASFE